MRNLLDSISACLTYSLWSLELASEVFHDFFSLKAQIQMGQNSRKKHGRERCAYRKEWGALEWENSWAGFKLKLHSFYPTVFHSRIALPLLLDRKSNKFFYQSPNPTFSIPIQSLCSRFVCQICSIAIGMLLPDIRLFVPSQCSSYSK